MKKRNCLKLNETDEEITLLCTENEDLRSKDNIARGPSTRLLPTWAKNCHTKHAICRRIASQKLPSSVEAENMT
jgi:hypothetical protein